MKLHALALAAALLAAEAARAAALTDGSTGAVQTLSGTFTVPQSLGTVRGANLFHSFTRFGIAPGESATFTTTDAGLRHVITRVTGGEASVLQGPLALQAAAGSRPEFVFVNPSGITVLEGARFDVPAGLHLSTGQQLRFADGTWWDTRSATRSSLTVAALESFGFLGGVTAAGLAISDWVHEGAEGGALSLTGGSVVLHRSSLSTRDAPLRLQAAGDAALQVPLTATGEQAAADQTLAASRGALTVHDSGLLASGAAPLVLGGGGIELVRSTAVALAGDRSGGLLRIVSGGSLLMEDSDVGSATEGTAAAADVHIRAGTDLRVRGTGDDGSSVNPGLAFIWSGARPTDTPGPLGPAGTVSLAAGGAMTIEGPVFIYSESTGASAGGRVLVSAADLTIDGQGYALVGIATLPFFEERVAARGDVVVDVIGALRLLRGGSILLDSVGDAPAGAVIVRAGSLLLDGTQDTASVISNDANAKGSTAGIRIQVSGPLTIEGFGEITSSTLGAGNAGSVHIEAASMRVRGPTQVVVDDAGVPTVGGVFSEAFPGSTGRGGGIEVRVAGALELHAQAAITSSSFSAGAAGRVSVSAGSLTVDGAGLASGASGIGSVSWLDGGPAGSVSVDVSGPLTLLRGGGISTDTRTDSAGGTISVRAGSLRIDGSDANGADTGIASRAAAGSGAAGQIDVRVAGRAELRAGAGISSATQTAGRGGSIRFEAAELLLDGRGAAAGSTGILANAGPESGGAVGRVDVAVSGLLMARDGAAISVANAAQRPGAAGIERAGLVVQAGRLELQRADITSAAAASGAAPVEVRSSGDLRMDQASIRTSATDGQGGSLRVDAGGTLLLRESRITTSVDGPSGGDGGNIAIGANALVLAAGLVQANTVASAARGGTVSIDARSLVPDGSHVFVGGDRILVDTRAVPGLNAIQAAAPDGVSGQLNLSLPQLNLAGALVPLSAERFDFGALARDICLHDSGSGFGVLGRGSLPARADALLTWSPR